MSGDTLRLGGTRVPVLHIMADGFPASSLQVSYHVRLDPLVRSRNEDGATLSTRRAIAEEYGERILRSAVREVSAALRVTPPDQQVICFVQNREMLRNLRNQLLEEHPFADTDEGEIDISDARLRPEQVGLLDSSISHSERVNLLDEQVRDRKRLLLMTSSGSRGVSFPRATTIIAFVPTFSVESAFMEIAQLIYRGRGTGIDPQTGNAASGDFFDRRLVLLLHDIVVTDADIDRRQWLRRTIDLIAALVLLRATVFTRITGDAGIPGQRACVVPVGRIGTDDLVLSISDAVRRFRRESGIYLRDTVPADRRALVEEARDATDAVFRNARWEGKLPDRTRRSVATASEVSVIGARVCSPAAALLELDGGPSLPDRTYVVGPLWLEQWDDVNAHESFEFEVRTARDQERVAQLRRRLAVIAQKRELGLPEALRRSARAVHEILDRPEFLDPRAFVVDRSITSTRVWVALPIAYHKFCGPNEEGETPEVEEPDQWLETMLRAVSVSASLTAFSPVLPVYRDRPFLALLTNGDPTGMERVFDDRYFMASTELNLLNTILFTGN